MTRADKNYMNPETIQPGVVCAENSELGKVRLKTLAEWRKQQSRLSMERFDQAVIDKGIRRADGGPL